MSVPRLLRRCMSSSVRLAHQQFSPKVNPQNKPVLLLHGLFGSKNNMRSAGIRLGKLLQKQVIGVDLRNHGTSEHAASMRYEDMVEDVAALTRELDIDLPIIIGHSLGGKVAMKYALTYPQKIEKLVVVDIAPTRYKRLPHFEYVKYMRAVEEIARKHGDRTEIRAELMRHVKSDSIVNFLMTNLVAADKGLKWRVNLRAIEWGMPDILGFPDFDKSLGKVFEKESFFIKAVGSGFIEDHHHTDILRLFPKSKIIPMGKHHWVHASNLNEFVDAVHGFLAK